MRKFVILSVVGLAFAVSTTFTPANAGHRNHHGGFGAIAPLLLAPQLFGGNPGFYEDDYCEIRSRRVHTRHGWRTRNYRYCY